MNTEIEIPPAYWDYDEGFFMESLPNGCDNAEELNLELRRLYRVAEDLVLFINKNKLPNPGEFAKKPFLQNLTFQR